MDTSIANASDAGFLLKVTPPRLPKTLAARVHLRSDRDDLADKSVMLVHAPSGFGKTSLLAQWRREWLARAAVVAWLTLDERDDGPRFAQGLSVAMRIASGRAAFDQPAPRWGSQDDQVLDRLTAWLAVVADLATETVLILDEAHLAASETVRQSLLYLMRNCPANLRIVVASRGSLELPVADLVAYGRLGVVTAEDLRFRIEETIELLIGRFGGRADRNAGARLHEITEGWPLGLQLALASLPREMPAIGLAIDQISARTGSIESYFVEVLMTRLSDAHSDFLVRMSILEMLNARLCESMQAGAADALAALRSATPIFIESMNDGWVRMHPLAQQFLRARFDTLAREDRHALHEKAAAWLAANGLYEQSARHVWQLGEEGHASALAERELYDVIVRGHSDRVLEWFDRLPQAEIQSRPRLRVAVGWALALGERHEAAMALLGHLPHDERLEPVDRFEAALICSGALFFADHVAQVEPLAAPWSEAPPTQSPQLRAIQANQKAAIALYRGMPDRARHVIAHAPSYETPPAEIDFIRGFGQWLVGLSYLWEGQPQLAAAALRPALASADQQLGRRSPVALLTATALASAQWDEGLPEEVSLTLVNRLDAVERVAAPDAVIMGYVSGARVAAIQGEERRAIDLLETLYSLGEARCVPRLRIASLAEQIRLHAQQRRGETCASLLNRLRSVDIGSDALAGPLSSLTTRVAEGRVALLRKEPDEALQILDGAAQLAERLRRGREGIEIKLLRAVALGATGVNADALLAEACSLAQSHGLMRIVADAHPDLANRVGKQRADAEAEDIAGDRKPAASRSPPRPSVTGLLTPKEREVLQLLARSLSNKQIALALGIGDETVKWHLKNLFGKLNAGTRDHLVDRARRLGMIEAG